MIHYTLVIQHTLYAVRFLLLFLQDVSEGSQVSIQDDPPSSHTNQNLMGSDAKFNYEHPVNGQVLHRDYLDVHIHQGEEPAMSSSSTGEAQVL